MKNLGAKFEAYAEKLNASIKSEMARKGAEATNELRNTELEVLSMGGSGKKYRNLPNRSSAPGGTPAPQSGKLRQEWDDETIVSGPKVTSRIKSHTKYAQYLENGTKKMGKRPFLKQIKEKAESKIRKIYGSDYRIQL